MCGIFGFVANQPAKIKNKQISSQIKYFFTLAENRGKEASGLAISLPLQTVILKSSLTASDFIKTTSYEKFVKEFNRNNLAAFMGHARLATNGFQSINDNNQPITGENLLISHNGIITNHRELWKKLDKVNTCPDSDSKVLLRLLQNNLENGSDLKNGLRQTYQEIEGSASLIIFNNFDHSVAISTNTGSLYWALFGDLGGYFFASESWMLKSFYQKFGKENKFIKIKQLKSQTAIIFQENKEDYQIFNLDEKSKSLVKKDKQKIIVKNKNFVDYSPLEFLQNKKMTKLYSVTNSLEKLKKHHFGQRGNNYIKRCVKCILPESTPFITFNKQGICNYCFEHQKIQYKGVEELKKLVAPFKNNNGQPDCLIAFSGGRDSSYGLHFLKKKLGLNPLAYTYDWGMVTDAGRRNQARIISKLGVEHIVISADITKKRQHINNHIRAWLKRPELGMVPLFMEGDKQCEFYADKLMKKYNINLMFFCRGNEFEKEEFKAGHCGVQDVDRGGVIHNLAIQNKLKMAQYYFKQYLRNPAYINASFFDTILAFFATYIQKHDYVFLWHYLPWKEDEIITTLKNEYNWESSSETTGTWRTDDGSSAFYNYIYQAVQGFTENDSFRSRQIREGLMSRSVALKLVGEENKPRYKALKWYFDQVGLDGDKVLTRVDKIKKLY